MFIVDLKRPKLQWTTEYAVVKQNINMVFEMFFAMLTMGLFFVIGMLFENVNYLQTLSVLAIIFGFAIIAIDIYVYNKQFELFDNIN